MDKMREEFEAWAINCDLCTFAVGDEYKYMTTGWAWRAWEASRAALCVELPSAWRLAEHEYKRQVEESLDSAGVSYE